jgi:hypothetical protein
MAKLTMVAIKKSALDTGFLWLITKIAQTVDTIAVMKKITNSIFSSSMSF